MNFHGVQVSSRQSLGQRLAQARRELAVRLQRDITQLDVAKAVGASAATVSRWEADTAVPREDALAALAEYFGVTPAFLRYAVMPSPMDELTRGARKLSEAELDRADAIAERAKPSIVKKRRRG